MHDQNSLKFVKYEEYPFRIKILNVADKRTAKIFSTKEGDELELPIFEWHYGDGKDSLVSESHLISFDLCSYDDLKMINRVSTKVNAVLKAFFERREEALAEVCATFGKFENKIYLIGDFSSMSLKIIPYEPGKKWVSPYKLNTSAEVKRYSDHLFSILTA